jgi:hypothetical protein
MLNTIVIIAVNVAKRLVMADSGELIAIADFMDEFGEICLLESEAVGAVCGPTSEGKWCFVTFSDYRFDDKRN